MALHTEPAAASVANDPAAPEAMRAAHDAGYRFPAGFHGFAASVAAISSVDGTTHDRSGEVIVRGPREIDLQLDGPEDLVGWTRQELASMAGHRWPTPYDQADGRWSLTFAEPIEGPLGRKIAVHGDPFQSAYRLRDGRIGQVIRTIGTTSFTITILSHAPTPDGRFLPAEFTVSYWDTGTGRLDRSDAYSDRYLEVDGVQLPASRRVVTAQDSGFSVRELRLADALPLDLETVEAELFLVELVDRATVLMGQRGRELRANIQGVGAMIADHARLSQALMALVDNAGKYGAPDTVVTISSRTVANQLGIEIIDRGPGLQPHEIDSIFERFYRADTARSRRLGGAGLGLSIARTIIEAHGGTLQIESQPGIGTTARVTIGLVGAAVPRRHILVRQVPVPT